MDPAIEKRIQSWLHPPFDDETKKEIERLYKTNPTELESAFFRDLSFGTGGMRGLMGIGTNRINIYTVRLATQGLAQYLQGKGKVFIGYDTRHNSQQFALESARVLAGNGLSVILAKEICPTPLTSFACRYFHCEAAIMITASHNPPQYNGYKVYWKDGGQLVPPHDQEMVENVRNIKTWTLAPIDSPLIERAKDDLEEAYLKEIQKLQIKPSPANKELQILYTNLHGTGLHLAKRALKNFGFTNLSLVTSQTSFDPDFPNAPYPNPEEESALKPGLDLLVQEKKDLLLATDPDADRMGVAVLHQGKAVRLTGNQVACLMLDHILSNLTKKTPNSITVKSIVTTEMFRKITLHYNLSCIDVLTGFKFIAEIIEKNPKHPFVFGAEESCGYLFGTYTRDKDGISACCILSEIAALAKQEKKTLIDLLFNLYEKYGIYREAQKSIAFSDSQEGVDQVKKIMQTLRQNPPKLIHQAKVIKVVDYLPGKTLPPSDVLQFELEDKTKLIVRPSGTEPKLKIYGDAFEATTSPLQEKIKACDLRLHAEIEALAKLISSGI